MSYPNFYSTAPAEPLTPTGRRRNNPRGDEVWNDARLEYAAGFSAVEVCRVYGLALSTFKARARAEGWRRMDLTVTDPQKLKDEADIAPPPAPPTHELIELVWRLMAEAAAEGRPNQTKSWMKVWRDLTGIEGKARERADAAAYKAKLMGMSPSVAHPSPSDGGGAGGGGDAVGGLSADREACRTPVTPNPNPSPIEGEGLRMRTLVPVLDSLDSKNDDDGVSPLERLNRRARRRLAAAEDKAERARHRAVRHIDKLSETLAKF